MADSRELKLLVTLKDKMTGQLNKVGEKTNTLGDKFTKLGTLIAGAFAVRQVSRFIGESIRLFGIQEKAEARLMNVMMCVNNATTEQVKSLSDYARELQGVTTFGDEQTISAMAMLGTFQLNTEQIKQLTPRILDMGSAMEKSSGTSADLESITIAVGKAMTSGIGSLSRYGVVITDTQKKAFDLADKQGKLDVITQALDGNFKGIAEGSAKTLTGSLEKLKNAGNDFKETIGKASLVLTKELVYAFGMNIEAMNQSEAKTGSLIIFINKLKLGFYNLGSGIMNIVNKLEVFRWQAQRMLKGGISQLITGESKAWDKYTEKIEQARAVSYSYEDTMADLVGEIDLMNEQLKEGTFDWNKFTGSVSQAGNSLSGMGSDAEEAGEKLEESKKKVADFTAELVKLTEEYNGETEKVAKNYAEAFVNQEEKVADLKRQINDEEDLYKKQQLNEELNREIEALDFFSHRRRQYEEQIREERKWRTKTDFEQTMIELSNEKNKLIEEFEAKKESIEADLRLEAEKVEKIKQIDDIALLHQDKALAKAEIANKNSVNKRIDDYNRLAEAVRNSASGIGTTQTTISGEMLQRAGQAVPAVPQIPQVNVTVNGDVSGEELVNKVSESLMNNLRLQGQLTF